MKRNFLVLAAVAVVAFAAAVATAVQTRTERVVDATISTLKSLGEKLNAAVFGYMANRGLALFSVATTVVQGDTYTGKHPVNTQPRGSEVLIVQIPITFPAAAPVANDLHILTRLLPGVQVIDFDLHLDDLDSNGAPACSLSLGEANATLADVTTVYQSGLTIGQTGGLVRHTAASQAAGLRAIGAATLQTERVLALKWDTASATYTASKTGLLVLKVTG